MGMQHTGHVIVGDIFAAPGEEAKSSSRFRD